MPPLLGTTNETLKYAKALRRVRPFGSNLSRSMDDIAPIVQSMPRSLPVITEEQAYDYFSPQVPKFQSPSQKIKFRPPKKTFGHPLYSSLEHHVKSLRKSDFTPYDVYQKIMDRGSSYQLNQKKKLI